MASSSSTRQVFSITIELGEAPTAKKYTLVFTVIMRSPKDFTPWDDDFKGTLLTTGPDLVKALEQARHTHSALVRMLIKATVDNSLIDGFTSSCPTAAALYKKMASLWSVTAAGAADIYFRQLITLKQREDEGMVALYSRMNELTTCLAAADQKPTDKQLLSFFTKAVLPAYNTHLEILMAQDPPPASVDSIFTSLVRKETQLKEAQQTPTDPFGKALYTGGHNPPSSSNSNYRQKPYQQQQQQQRESPDSGDKAPYRGKGGFNGICNYCKEHGHIKRDCPKLANKNKNRDIQKQLDEIHSRLHALCAAQPPASGFTFGDPY